jgi:hypothetical protein
MGEWMVGGELERPPSQQKKSWAWWHMPVILVKMGSIKKEDHGPVQFRQKARSRLQNKQNEKGWRGVAQGV